MTPTLLIDPHRLFRQGLMCLLEGSRYQVVAEHASIEEALASRSSEIGPEPRLIVLDPGADRPQSLQALRSAMPGARLVMLTSNLQTDRLRQAVEAHADGYLTKDHDPGELIAALDRVMDGQILLPAGLTPFRIPVSKPAAPRGLTVREAEILRRLVNGDSNRMIADHLSLSEMVVKASVKQLLRKIKAANRTQAALWAIHQGLDRPRALSA
ncbi:response regulator transcription factor [Skermanella mucosa]|uniref:LuxR C-terminal-related transcriptional regulator n=1 Tax=Skermanella mucosa TaxID=1789672 RepID=UPI00192A7EBD|nr:response regulator transcription factor [Skermanella mucosa]UEM23011.1 response regulator transcription factor [Skermanella mucosa]